MEQHQNVVGVISPGDTDPRTDDEGSNGLCPTLCSVDQITVAQDPRPRKGLQLGRSGEAESVRRLSAAIPCTARRHSKRSLSLGIGRSLEGHPPSEVNLTGRGKSSIPQESGLGLGCIEPAQTDFAKLKVQGIKRRRDFFLSQARSRSEERGFLAKETVLRSGAVVEQRKVVALVVGQPGSVQSAARLRVNPRRADIRAVTQLLSFDLVGVLT